MYTYITVDDLKKHLNIDPEFTDDDNYLLSLIQVSQAVVQRHICSLLVDLLDEGGNLPFPLRQAILLYCGNLYSSRESIAFGGSPVEVPFSYGYLLDLYKNYGDTTSSSFNSEVLDGIARGTILIDEDIEVTEYNKFGDVEVHIIPGDSLKGRAIKRIADSVQIDENGNMITNIEKI